MRGSTYLTPGRGAFRQCAVPSEPPVRRIRVDEFLDHFRRFLEGEDILVYELGHLFLLRLGHHALVEATNRIGGHRPCVALVLHLLLQKTKHIRAIGGIGELDAACVTWSVPETCSFGEISYDLEVRVHFLLELSIELEEIRIVVYDRRIALFGLEYLRFYFFRIQFRVNARSKLEHSFVFLDALVSGHAREEIIAETAIVTAVYQEAGLPLYLCTANNTLRCVFYLIENTIGRDKSHGEKIQLWQALYVVHFYDAQEVCVAIHLQRERLLYSQFADGPRLSTKPPTLAHEWLEYLPFKNPDLVVVIEELLP